MQAGVERICALSGLLITACLVLALWPLAGFFPPPSPTDSAQFYAAHYAGHLGGIRVAAMLLACSGSLYGALFAGVAAQVRRMEGGASGALTYMLLVSSAIAGATLFLSGLFFGLAAFRPEQSLDMLRMLTDLAWFELVMPGLPATLQAFAIGLAVLGNTSATAAFPRWFGYLNLWFGVLFFPGMLVMIFKTGPFAWDGLFAFWFPAVLFCAWILLISRFSFKMAGQT